MVLIPHRPTQDQIHSVRTILFPPRTRFCCPAAAGISCSQTLPRQVTAALLDKPKWWKPEQVHSWRRRLVTTGGIQLVDPTTAKETAKIGEGHLHYRVDDGPVIATTATKLSFHELSSGEHKISITLAGNDHKPLTDPITFIMTVP